MWSTLGEKSSFLSPQYRRMDPEDPDRECLLPQSKRLGEKVRKYKRPEKAPIRRSLWINTSLLIIGDILGAGIIELPGNLRVLGWGFGIPSIVIFLVISYYLGVLVSRLASMFSSALTFGDLAEPSCGRIGYIVAHWSQQIYLVLTCGLYVLLASKSLQLMLYDYELCQPIAGLIIAAIFLIPAQLRNLHEISFIALLSFLCIVGYILICLHEMSGNGQEGGGGTTMSIAEDTDFASFSSALMGIVFAFSGIEVYLEFIAEMKDPENFYKALRFSLGTVGLVYICVSSYTYWLFGQDTPPVLTMVIKQGTPLRVANGLLLVHLVATYCIKQQVVLRAAQVSISPKNANSTSFAAIFQWFAFSVVMVLVSWLLANAIPFFSDFCSLLGAFMDTTLCIILPITIALQAHRLNFAYLGITELPFLKFMVVFGVFVALLGCIGTTKQLVDHWDKFGYPFSCMEVDPSDTSEFF